MASDVVVAAEIEAAQYGDLVKKMNRKGTVHGYYREMLKRRDADRIAREPVPPPRGPFRVIVVDPPGNSVRANKTP